MIIALFIACAILCFTVGYGVCTLVNNPKSANMTVVKGYPANYKPSK